MDTKELKTCLEQYSFLTEHSLGVFPSDMLPNIRRFPAFFIANTDDSENSGQHWVAFYATDGREIEYFDSYGFKPFNQHFREYISENFRTNRYNKKRIQGELTTTCGQYCLAYLFYRTLGISLDEFIKKIQHE
jgi:hypothetical protein